MGNQRFSIVPAAAVADTKLTDSLFRTLAALGLYGDQHGWCWPSQGTLAEIRGVTRVTINNHIKQLVKFGYLNIHARYDDDTGAQKSNAMQIRFDHEYLPPCKAQTLHPLSSPELYTPHKTQDFTHNDPDNDPDNDSDALPELVNYFLAVSHCRKPSNGEYKRSQWMDPIVAIYQAAGGDFNETKERIKQSIAILKEKNYTVANPGSIQNTAVSLTPGTNGKGKGLDLWDSQVMAWVHGRSQFSDLDEIVRDAIRQCGGDGIKAMNTYQLNEAKKQFTRITT